MLYQCKVIGSCMLWVEKNYAWVTNCLEVLYIETLVVRRIIDVIDYITAAIHFVMATPKRP